MSSWTLCSVYGLGKVAPKLKRGYYCTYIKNKSNIEKVLLEICTKGVCGIYLKSPSLFKKIKQSGCIQEFFPHYSLNFVSCCESDATTLLQQNIKTQVLWGKRLMSYIRENRTHHFMETIYDLWKWFMVECESMSLWYSVKEKYFPICKIINNLIMTICCSPIKWLPLEQEKRNRHG